MASTTISKPIGKKLTEIKSEDSGKFINLSEVSKYSPESFNMITFPVDKMEDVMKYLRYTKTPYIFLETDELVLVPAKNLSMIKKKFPQVQENIFWGHGTYTLPIGRQKTHIN